MIVQNLIDELDEIVNKTLDAVILNKGVDFKSVPNIEETELSDNQDTLN